MAEPQTANEAQPQTASPESAASTTQTTPPAPTSEANKKFTSINNPMPKKSKSHAPKSVIIAVIVVLLGIGSGYGLHQVTGQGSSSGLGALTTPSAENDVTEGETYGSKQDVFADDAEGVLVSGGNNGEGTHRLLREGGDSQTICLTSSVMDLDLFEDTQVKIWGETFDAQKCAWFMDVGRVQVITVNAEKPFELEE